MTAQPKPHPVHSFAVRSQYIFRTLHTNNKDCLGESIVIGGSYSAQQRLPPLRPHILFYQALRSRSTFPVILTPIANCSLESCFLPYLTSQ